MTTAITVTAPRVHINGSSKESLLRQTQDMHEAIEKAIDTFRINYPHARDFYVLPKGTYEQACSEHDERVAKLRAVQAEVLALWEAIDEQS